MESLALDGLQSSNQRALRGLAMEIIIRPVGDRLDTTLAYQKKLGVGAGTVQKSLRLIESVGAAELRASGHQGTFIKAKQIGRLWSLAGLGPIRMLLTPPGAIEFHRLSTALAAEFDRLQIPLVQRFARGADQRTILTANGTADVAVTSSGYAEQLSGDEWRSWDLGPHSYYARDSLQVIRRTDGEPPRRLRVGIDRESLDHSRLTTAQFGSGRDVRLVDCDFQRIPADILEGRFDVGVWHRMELLIPLELCGLTGSVLNDAAASVAESVSGAALVVPTDRPAVAAVLDAIDLPGLDRALRAPDPASDAAIWAR